MIAFTRNKTRLFAYQNFIVVHVVFVEIILEIRAVIRHNLYQIIGIVGIIHILNLNREIAVSAVGNADTGNAFGRIWVHKLERIRTYYAMCAVHCCEHRHSVIRAAREAVGYFNLSRAALNCRNIVKVQDIVAQTVLCIVIGLNLFDNVLVLCQIYIE